MSNWLQSLDPRPDADARLISCRRRLAGGQFYPDGLLDEVLAIVRAECGAASTDHFANIAA